MPSDRETSLMQRGSYNQRKFGKVFSINKGVIAFSIKGPRFLRHPVVMEFKILTLSISTLIEILNHELHACKICNLLLLSSVIEIFFIKITPIQVF